MSKDFHGAKTRVFSGWSIGLELSASRPSAHYRHLYIEASSQESRPTFLTSVLILSRAFVFIRFSGFRLYIELCNMPVDSFCNQCTLSNFSIVLLYCIDIVLRLTPLVICPICAVTDGTEPDPESCPRRLMSLALPGWQEKLVPETRLTGCNISFTWAIYRIVSYWHCESRQLPLCPHLHSEQ